MSGTAGEADCHVRALPFLAMTVITGSLPLLLVLPQMIGTAVPRMSLRTSPQTIRAKGGDSIYSCHCEEAFMPTWQSVLLLAPPQMIGTAGEADCHVRALPFLAMTVTTGSLPLLLVLPQMIGTAVPRMSLRTSPQTGVAIRPPFGTAPDDRSCRGKRIATSGLCPSSQSARVNTPL